MIETKLILSITFQFIALEDIGHCGANLLCCWIPFMWDYKSSLFCLEFPIFLLISNSYIKRILNSYQGYEYDVKCIFKTILQISTWFLGQGKFPAHRLLLLCFLLLKIQQQEKRKIMEWRQRRSWGSFNFLIDWRKSPACWPAGDKNQWDH